MGDIAHPRRLLLGALFSAAAVAAVTGLIALLEPTVPVLSLGSLYLFAVLPTATVFGLPLAVAVSVASMLAFNWFFLPPTHTFQLRDGENWFALAVYLVTAVVVSALAARSRRRAEAALEAESLRRTDAAKTAVLQAVSHDLRSPLMAIRTAASSLSRADLAFDEADRSELLATIVAGTERLDRVVANLLDLSRLQAGAAPPRPELWAVDDLVVQALEEVGDDRGRVAVEVPENLPPVQVDALQVERALVNLLENALKFSPPAEAVRLSGTAAAGEVVLRIADHGPGLAEGESERVFQPFQRGSAGGLARGAGLGLAIARGFAEANGGRVWVERSRRDGAEFALALPAAGAR